MAQKNNSKESQSYRLKSKDALKHLLSNKILVLDANENSIKLDLKNESAASVLEELKNEGLLDEEAADHGSWCE